MNNKFEEAKYINGTVTKIYPIEEVTALRNHSLEKYNEIKNNFFCPECERPHLVHNLCKNHNSYFSTSKGQSHIVGCSYECDMATKKILSCLEEQSNLERLYARLQNCLLMLTKGESMSENPFVLCQETDYEILKSTATLKSAYEKRYYIPRKRLTSHINDDIIGELKLFYGTVQLAWFSSEGYYPHRLCIYHLNDERIICSLEFSDNVYNHLDVACKLFDKKKRFKASIAFFTKINVNIIEKRNSNVIEQKKFYNGIINDSRKIAFLEISNIDRP